MSADVITWLEGGLGNHLFQYAATLRALRESGGSSYRLVLVDTAFSPIITDFADVDLRPVGIDDRARWIDLAIRPGPLRPFLHRSAMIREPRSTRTVLRESGLFSPPPPIERGEPLLLRGFFQHPAWWADDWMTVARALVARAPDGYADLVAHERAVISLRQRGDYSRLGWALMPGHYDQVIDALRALGCAEVVVLADELALIPWFTRVLEAAGLRVLAPTRLTGDKATDDFWNLAAARTMALPNSTFSWWAGAVATARDPEVNVLFPDPWLRNYWSDAGTPRLGLPGWQAIASEFPPPRPDWRR